MVSNVPFATIEGSIVDIVGKDADAIWHNLTTNDVKILTVGQCVESFVTEVRGRTVGHGYVTRQPDGFRFVGAPGQSEAIAQHVDRYTIREDATAVIRDREFWIQVWGPGASDDRGADLIPVDWLGASTHLRLVETASPADTAPPCPETTASFHDARIGAGYPWHGIDFDASHLPQEVDRDAQAISFHKGCYLGQETVARLDAMGQVQKKLVSLAVLGDPAAAGDVIQVDEKPQARITSVTRDGQTALAMVRRAWFEPETMVAGIRENGNPFEARVIA